MLVLRKTRKEVWTVPTPKGGMYPTSQTKKNTWEKASCNIPCHTPACIIRIRKHTPRWGGEALTWDLEAGSLRLCFQQKVEIVLEEAELHVAEEKERAALWKEAHVKWERGFEKSFPQNLFVGLVHTSPWYFWAGMEQSPNTFLQKWRKVTLTVNSGPQNTTPIWLMPSIAFLGTKPFV